MASSHDGAASTPNAANAIMSEDERTPQNKRRKNIKPRNLRSYGKSNTKLQPLDSETKTKDKSASHKTDSDMKKPTSSREKQLVLKEPMSLPLVLASPLTSNQVNEPQAPACSLGFEQCVLIIRHLECSGHVESSFRQKFLTWFSLRATNEEINVVKTFMHCFKDDSMALAEQLVDTFSDSIARKGGSGIGDSGGGGGSSGTLFKKPRH